METEKLNEVGKNEWTEEFIDLQKTIWRNSSASNKPSWGVRHSESQEEAIGYVVSNLQNGFGKHEKDLDIWLVWFGKDAKDELFTVAITGNGIKGKDNALLIQEAFAHYNDALVEIQRLQKTIAVLEAELKAKTKWSAGHPEHSGEVLVYVRTKRLGHKDFDLFYSMDYWDNTIGKWAWYDADGEVLGWCERDNFDLPIESSETTGHLEEEEE